MVNTCSAYGCNARYKKGLSFFRFPRNEIRRIQWAIAVRRKNWMPSNTSCLCEKHFQTGRPSRDENHPDYIPNVFVFNENQTRSLKSYEKRKALIEKLNRQVNNADKTNCGNNEMDETYDAFETDSGNKEDDTHDAYDTDSRNKANETYDAYEMNSVNTEADETNFGNIETAADKISGNDKHVSSCNSCLCKDAEIYFLIKDKEELQKELKMLQAEVQILREEFLNLKYKKT